MSLAAVALDIEATGLDAKTARVIEISALRVDLLRIDLDDIFQHLIDPGVPIPEPATQIHGITESELRGAPAFSHLVEPLDRFIGNAVLIGHNIGYDLAVIDHEHARLGRSGRSRLLSMFVLSHDLPLPILPDTRLRHSAIGLELKSSAGTELSTMRSLRPSSSSVRCRCCAKPGFARSPRQRLRQAICPAKSDCIVSRAGYRRHELSPRTVPRRWRQSMAILSGIALGTRCAVNRPVSTRRSR